MKTVLRHKHTKLYLKAPEMWTDEPESAFDFRFIDRALKYAETWELGEVEVAFVSADLQRVRTLLPNKAEALCLVA